MPVCKVCEKTESKYWRLKKTICESCYQEPRKIRNKEIKRYRNGEIKNSELIFIKCGCTLEQLIKHIESLWESKMSWDNYGEWHIDHIVPLCSSADLSNVLHFSNIRPLWKNDNLVKSGQDKKQSINYGRFK